MDVPVLGFYIVCMLGMCLSVPVGIIQTRLQVLVPKSDYPSNMDNISVRDKTLLIDKIRTMISKRSVIGNNGRCAKNYIRSPSGICVPRNHYYDYEESSEDTFSTPKISLEENLTFESNNQILEPSYNYYET